MKYMVMLGGTKAMADWFMAWTPQEHAAQGLYMEQLHADLAAEGVLVGGEGLSFPHEALTIRAAANGTPVTDGVFPESKEFLMGYTLIDVETLDDAVRIAARFSAAPGPGGTPSNMPIELRRIMSGRADGE